MTRSSFLRAQSLYLIPGLVVVGIYGASVLLMRQASVSAPAHQAGEDAATTVAVEGEDMSAWWPQRLDLAALQRLMKREPRLALALSLVTVCGLGLGVGGLVMGVWSLFSGRIRCLWRFVSHSLPAWSFVEVSLIILVVFLAASLLHLLHVVALLRGGGLPFDAHLHIVVSMLVLDACVILTILAFAAGKRSTIWGEVGLSPAAWLSSIGVGLRGYTAAFPWIGLVLMIVVEGARALGWRPPAEPLQELIFHEHRPSVLWLTILLACVVGPVTEELFFRGVLYTAVRRRASWVTATCVSAGLFAMLHGNPVGFPAIFLLGCLLANVYERTGSLAGSLTVHILHNTFLIGLALVVRHLLVLSGE